MIEDVIAWGSRVVEQLADAAEAERWKQYRKWLDGIFTRCGECGRRLTERERSESLRNGKARCSFCQREIERRMRGLNLDWWV